MKQSWIILIFAFILLQGCTRTDDGLCQDDDGDGYGKFNTTISNCQNPEFDCDDSNQDINPGMSEVCGNAIDEDCDGFDQLCDHEVCSDGTAFGACSSDQPLACVDGILKFDCGLCGCPTGYLCLDTGLCAKESECADGNCSSDSNHSKSSGEDFIGSSGGGSGRGSRSECGDGTCNAGEDCSDCPSDCGACPVGGDCTINVNPGESIQSAVNSASYGDVICIAPGTYSERVHVNTPGVSIVGQTRRTATVVNGFQINVPDVRIEGLRLTTDGHLYHGPMYVWDEADNTKIYDNYFFDVDSVFSIFAPNGHAVAPNNVHVKGNDFYHVQAGIFAYGDNWLVEDNEIDTLFKYNSHDSDYARFIGSGHVFRNNYWHGALFANTGSAHVDCFQSWDENTPLVTSDILIENNTCFGFHQFMMLNSQDGDLNRMTVRNNIAVNFPEFGYLDRLQFIINQDVTDMLIEHNTFYGYIERGVLMAEWGGPNSPSGIIRNNLLYGTGPGHWTEGCDPACEVSNNMIWGFTGSAGVPPDPDDILDSTDFVNPVVTNDRSQWMPLNPVACTGGTGGTYIGAVPCS